MKEKVNPVIRVQSILKEALGFPNNLKIRDAWAKVFGFETTNSREILLAHADFIHLVDEAREAMQNLDVENTEVYIRPFDKLQLVLSSINLEARWDQFTKQIDEVTMASLEYCADRLGSNWSEFLVDTSDLSTLMEVVQALMIEVMESDYDQELKMVILDCLRTIENAILTYHLRGAAGLRKAMESTLGSLFFVNEKIQKLPQREKEGSGVFAKFMKCIGSVNKVSSAAQGIKALAPTVIALISGGSGN